MHRRYGEDGAGYLASMIAYHAFLSLFPMLLVAFSAVGFVLADRPELRDAWVAAIGDAVPGSRALFGDGIGAVVEARAGLGLVGLAGLVWSGTGVVRAAGHALGKLYGIADLKGIRAYAWALGAFAGLGALAVLSTGAAAAVGAGTGLVAAAGLVVTFALDVLLFMVAYRVLTQRKGPPFRGVWRGAVLAAAGWTALKLGGSWYAARSIADARPVYGAFAVTVGALLLLSLAARLFMYGAELNLVTGRRWVPMERTTDTRAATNGHATNGDRGVGELMRSIATGTGTLVRKEVELARNEVSEAIATRARAFGIVAAGGVFAIVGMIFLGLAASAALATILEPGWLPPLAVGAGFIVLGPVAAWIAFTASKRPKLSLEETRRTIKEDVEWARAQLKR